MSTHYIPSASLLRAMLKANTFPQCAIQVRNASNYMPRHKFAAVTRLDKLHRTQKAALRQQKLAAIQRADALSASLSAETQTQLPFTISRTPSSQLPIYESAKNGGNRQITTIRKLQGDLDSLATQLRTLLKIPEFTVDRKGNKKAGVAVNRLTRQVVVKGWRGQEVKAWMEAAGF